MWIVAGLGNPGAEHRLQRHNIGFMALDNIVRRHWPMGNWRQRFHSESMEFSFGDSKLLALKPQTFMNLSGNAVGEAAKFYKIPVQRIVALHDDLDLDLGRMDFKQGGGHGGHNGLKSLDAQIGNEYWRLRIGIGHPVKKFAPGSIPKEHKDMMVHTHVLSNFSREDATVVDPVLDRLAEAFPVFFKDGAEEFRTLLRDPVTLTGK